MPAVLLALLLLGGCGHETEAGDLYESRFDRYQDYDRPVMCRVVKRYHNEKWHLQCNGGARERAVTDAELAKQYRYSRP